MKIYAFIKIFSGLLLATLLIFNGIFNLLMGEIFSEGMVIFVTILFLMLHLKLSSSIRRSAWPIFMAILGIISYNCVIIAFDGLFYRFLFFYQYFLLLLIIVLSSHEVENSYIVKIIIIFSCISSLFALSQRLGFEILLPLESEIRATGLSRSSLNLSGLLLLIFTLVNIIYVNDIKKWLILSIIFIGILSAGGRGAIVSAVLVVLLSNFATGASFKTVVYVVCFLYLYILIFGDWFTRAFSTFDFVKDQSNIDRLGSYAEFLDQFSFFGEGIGTTSPALSRFGPTTGFESFALNTIYELGVPFLILLIIGFIFYFKNLKSQVRKNLFLFGISIAPIFFGQQMLGTPSVFCCLCLVYYLIVCNIHKVSF